MGTCVFAGEYYLHQGVGAHNAGQKSLAGYYLYWGRTVAPWNADFPWRSGQFLMKEGRMQEACAAFEESLRLNPNQVMVHVTLAEAKLMVAQAQPKDTPENAAKALSLFDESVREARAALALCPSLAAADDTLGRAASLCATLLAAQEREDVRARAKEYWETARDHLRRAVANNQVRENSAGIYRNLGRVCIALDDLDGAEDALARAAQADLGDKDTWPLFLEFARDRQRYERLRAVLTEQIDWLRRRPEPDGKALATAHLFLANVLENGYRDLDGAENAYKTAVKTGPRQPEVWTNYARFSFEHGRVKSFEESIQRSCRELESQASEKPLYRVASVDLVLRRGPEALENATLVLASAVRGADPVGPMPLGQAFGWSAVMLFEVLQQRPQTDPGVCSSAFNLAIVFSNIGEYDRAERLFEAAKGCLPAETRAPLAVQWADMRVRQDRANEALALLSEAAAQHPEDFETRWAIARTLVKLGRNGEARDAYAEVRAMPTLDEKGRALIDEELKRLDRAQGKGAPEGG
jgi:tetratricopeptide (TPR) repeat protein